jgi:hypothetical protein
MKDNNPQPEQIEALVNRLRGVAGRMTRVQLGKLLKVSDQQLSGRLTRNIREVETPPVERPTSGITIVSVGDGEREYQLIGYWESGKVSFTTVELLAKAEELNAEGTKDDIDWFRVNGEKAKEKLPKAHRQILVFTGFKNSRRTVPYLASWRGTLSYKNEAGLWRLDHTWFVKRIK